MEYFNKNQFTEKIIKINANPHFIFANNQPVSILSQLTRLFFFLFADMHTHNMGHVKYIIENMVLSMAYLSCSFFSFIYFVIY